MVAGLIVGGILNDLVLSGGFDVPRFDSTQSIPILPPVLLVRADLASSVGWVRRAARSWRTQTPSNAP